MRRREFDSDQVLAEVMNVFWRRGYLATSIDDLTQETGVSRSGLYGVWKSKKGLFLEATKIYERLVVDQIIGKIEGTDLGLAGVRQAFETVAAATERLGCLICNTSSEVAATDEDIAAVVSAFHRRVRAAFAHCLENARRSGEIRAEADLDALADFLLVSFQGVAHAIRSPMPASAVANFVEGVLRAVAAA